MDGQEVSGTKLEKLATGMRQLRTGLSSDVLDKSKDVVEKGKQDARSLQQWATAVLQAMLASFLAGMKASVSLSLAIFTPRMRSALGVPLAVFAVALPLLALFRAYIYEIDWLYWIPVILLNEYINYSIVQYQHSLTLVARLDKGLADVQESVGSHISNITQTFKKTKKMMQKSLDSYGDVRTAGKQQAEEKEEEREERAKNKLLAKVLVAKMMSYCLIWAYLEDIVDVAEYTNIAFLVSLVDFPVTCLLLSYFVAENRILVLKGKNFLERIDYLREFLFYHLGYGFIMTVIFFFVPYGEVLCSYYHVLLLCAQFKQQEVSKAILNIDPVEYAERVCFRVVDYLI